MYDPVGRRILVACGYDLWQWNGSAWTWASGAPNYAAFGAAWDTRRSRLVVVPFDQGAGRQPTMEWNGATGTWQAQAPPPPGAAAWVYEPAVVFDESSGVTVLTNGARTATWDGVAWTSFGPVGSLPAPVTALGYDPALAAVTAIWNGAYWRWTGSAWVPVPGGAAAFATGAHYRRLAGDPARGTMLLSTGADLWTRTATAAEVAESGAACTVPGAVEAYVASFGRPRVGDSQYAIEMRGGPSQVALLVWSTATGSLVLPGGGGWRLGPAAALMLVPLSPAGFASFPQPIPNTLALRGVQLYAQAAVLEPAAALGFLVTQRLACAWAIDVSGMAWTRSRPTRCWRPAVCLRRACVVRVFSARGSRWG